MNVSKMVRALPAVALVGAGITAMPDASADYVDYRRLNESVVVNVYTIQKKNDCLRFKLSCISAIIEAAII